MLGYWYLGDYSVLFYVLAIGIMIWSLIVRGRLNRLVKKYSDIPVASGKDANTCVREMLQANEVYGVTINHIPGDMTDNFNPKEEVINLSDTSYGQNSISAVAVAAHECGHACQAYSGMLLFKIRQIIAPAANITSRISVWITIIGVVIMYAARSLEMNSAGYWISTIGIALYSIVFLFYLVTLPVERNASRRGLKAMKECGWVSDSQLRAAKKVLWAAGDTYAVALASSALTLLRLLLMRGRRRR
ncbi:MAG: zinc metallopeptidase [Lachnospiraceae bacterium]|nr:zinc metallopeptidase [Lachnospiraceae bacterium]